MLAILTVGELNSERTMARLGDREMELCMGARGDAHDPGARR